MRSGKYDPPQGIAEAGLTASPGRRGAQEERMDWRGRLWLVVFQARPAISKTDTHFAANSFKHVDGVLQFDRQTSTAISSGINKMQGEYADICI